MKPRYECDKCGACCRTLIIEIGYIDVLREPRLRQSAKPFKISEDERFYDENDDPIADDDVDPFMAGAMLACGGSMPCKHLEEIEPDHHGRRASLCSIYPTRPNTCVGFEAGSEQCQAAREMAGLAKILPMTASTADTADGTSCEIVADSVR